MHCPIKTILKKGEGKYLSKTQSPIILHYALSYKDIGKTLTILELRFISHSFDICIEIEVNPLQKYMYLQNIS